MSLDDLNGKTAIVTGGGSGISLAFTLRLLEAGCNVVVADLALSPEADALNKYTETPKAIFQKTDVTDWAQLDAAFKTAHDSFGRIDIVCTGAGLSEPPKTSFWALKSSTDAQSSSFKVLEINLHHPIRCTQLALDYATRQNSRCSVIMISSAAAQQPGTAIPLYAASKAGINNFVKSMAPMEPAKGVRVVAVAPGSVLTPFWASREGWVGEGEWIPMEEVVNAMFAMISQPEYPGGTVLEITRGSTRKVELVNDPGPVSGTGATITNVALPRAEMIGLLSTEYGK
ncbi:hypothetical protein Q7P35_009144 [Cladosporium inversicolor]